MAGIEEKAQIQWKVLPPELFARAAMEQETFLCVPCSARLGEKQLRCEAGGCLSHPGQGMENRFHELVQLCRLVATAEPRHVHWFTPPSPGSPPGLAQGHQGHQGHQG